jgi:hypothetical protein
MKNLKVVFHIIMLITFFSCTKEEENTKINGVWKMLTFTNTNCMNNEDNIEINFIDGCIQNPINTNLSVCWEFRFEENKMITILTEKNIITGDTDEDREEIYYKIKNNNTILSLCDNPEFSNCDEDHKIELSPDLLIIHIPEGYDSNDCYSILTLKR